GGIFVFLGELDAVECLGQRADLVHFDENGVGDPAIDGFAQKLDVGNQKIVADELHSCAHGVRQLFPSVPVILRTTILDRDDRELPCQLFIVGNQLLDG